MRVHNLWSQASRALLVQVHQLVSNRVVTYLRGGILIKAVGEVDSPCLALVHLFQSNYGIQIYFQVCFWVRVQVPVRLGLAPGGHPFWLRDDPLQLLCWCCVSWWVVHIKYRDMYLAWWLWPHFLRAVHWVRLVCPLIMCLEYLHQWVEDSCHCPDEMH